MIEATLHLKEEKKHSVRYDSKESDGALTSIYIMKSHLTKPWPQAVKVRIEPQ